MEVTYIVEYKEDALKDIAFWKKSGNIAVQKKISSLIADMELHPFTGKGKPEALRFDLAGAWSRRINTEHRIVYGVEDNRIIVYSLKGHY